jgi:Ser-tRNA(Ala) deacylase AlaX
MDNKLAAIAKMIDDAIRVAETEAKKNAALRESYELAAKNLGEIREGLLSGRDSEAVGGRHVGNWQECGGVR